MKRLLLLVLPLILIPATAPVRPAAAQDAPERRTLEQWMERQDAQVAAGNFEAAEAEAKERTRTERTNPEARFLLGRLYGNANRLDEARVQFEGALELDFTYAPGWRGMAKVHLRQGEFATALEEVRKSLSMDPENREGIVLLAECLYQSGDRPGAFRTVEDALKRHPEDTNLRFFLASLLYNDGNARDAEKELRQVVAQDPKHTAARKLLVFLLVQLNRPAEAIEACRAAIAAVPLEPEFRVLLRDVLVQGGDLEGAVAAVTELLRLENLAGDFRASVEKDLALLQEALANAGRTAKTPTLEELLKALSSPDVLVRRDVMARLLEMDLPGIPEEVARAVTDKDEQVRVFAVQMLTRGGGPAAAGLFEVLLFHPRDRDPSDRVRAFAARGLGAIGSPAVLPVLMRAVEEQDPEILRSALWGIFEITGRKFVDDPLAPVPESARPRVRDAYREWWTGDGSLWWRKKSVRAAGEAGSRSLFKYVVPWLTHGDAGLRQCVRDGVVALTGDGAWADLPLDTEEQRAAAVAAVDKWIANPGDGWR